MKRIFVEARYKKTIRLPRLNIPDSVGVFTTVQFIRQLPAIVEQLKKQGKRPKVFKTQHSRYRGQVLGCNIEKYKGIDAILYIGDGTFHPIALSVKNDCPVYTFNPFSAKLESLDESQVQKYRKKRELGLKKFYMSEKIGILVSTKPGQNQLRQALALKKKLDKKSYIFISDEIDFHQLENFSFIDCFVNTACRRISFDDFPRPIVDIEDLNYSLG